jgi:hypothetical protein
MRTRTVLSTALAVWSLGLLAAGTAHAERTLLGITVGRSYRTVLAKYGNPDRTDAVYLATGTAPQLGAQYGGVGGFGSQPGFPGAGGPGLDNSGAAGGFPGAPGGSPYGAPTSGGFPGSAGAFSGGAPGGPGGFPGAGGPPILPGAGPGGFSGAEPGENPGGFPGAPGGFGGPAGGFGGPASGFGGQNQQQPSQGNAAMWTYRRQGGVTMEFLINEDGLVAQISVSGRTYPTSTSKGIRLGSGYSQVLTKYGFPDSHRIMALGQSGVQQAAMPYSSVVKSGGQVQQVTYSSKHNAAFTLLNNKVVRMTVALAE